MFEEVCNEKVSRERSTPNKTLALSLLLLDVFAGPWMFDSRTQGRLGAEELAAAALGQMFCNVSG